MNMSMLQTADEASGLENSFVLSVEYERRDFNEIDVLGTLDRDDNATARYSFTVTSWKETENFQTFYT